MLLKGAIVGLDRFNPVASVNVFQYNPHTLTRTLTPQIAEGTRSRGETLRLSGPPKETIKLDIEIDAVDRMETDDATAPLGIHPQLASLEMLIYPKIGSIIANATLSSAGVLEVVPPEMPLTLFIWGPSRVVPVKITGLSITETAYDHLLNPIRAQASLTLEVLNTQHFSVAHPGFALSLAHQGVKEAMAIINAASVAVDIVTGG